MTPDQLLMLLYKSRRNVQNELTDVAAYTHGWNAAIDHIVSLLRGN